MKIFGRRIHIAGSASNNCDAVKLKYAHELVRLLSEKLLEKGASLCVQPGKEPLSELDATVPLIFDWTVLDAIHAYSLSNSRINLNILPLTTVISEKTQQHIPEARSPIWRSLLDNSLVEILNHPPQWTAGGIRRERIAISGDAVILLSGGEGVEHLAQLYVGQRKPVIALDLDLGASTEQGAGRAVAINRKISSNPLLYYRPKNAEAIGSLLNNISTRDATRPIHEVVEALLLLLDGLEPPTAFCVRLLDTTSHHFNDVEYFFSNFVNPIIQEMDYRLIVSPQSTYQVRWLNEQIFASIHDSALVIADLTGERPNCFIELGYALGRNRHVLICAKEDTRLPFDIDKIECFFWSQSADPENLTLAFREFLRRNVIQAPLTSSTTLF